MNMMININVNIYMNIYMNFYYKHKHLHEHLHEHLHKYKHKHDLIRIYLYYIYIKNEKDHPVYIKYYSRKGEDEMR